MTITLGQLVASLYSTYDRQLHDEELAAVATEVRMTELFASRDRARRERARAKAA